MVLSCRMWKMTCIPFVFPAEQTRRISRFLCCISFCNIPWIFFRFWQVNRDIHLTKFCIRCPLFILYNPVCADIVCCLAEMIIKVGCSLWRYLIFFFKSFSYHRRSRCQNPDVYKRQLLHTFFLFSPFSVFLIFIRYICALFAFSLYRLFCALSI